MARLQEDASAVAVSCHAQFVGPRDEPLYCTEIPENRLNEGLGMGENGRFHGPAHHGSVMMRRQAYEAVGGYRAVFYFAQDLDLWTRLAERGRFGVVPEVLYRARLEAHSISGTQTREQGQLAQLIWEAAQARRAGVAEGAFLASAGQIRPVRRGDLAQRVALGNYFIGSCLRKTNPKAAAGYFSEALTHDPRLWRARVRLIQTRIASLQ
jgi:hypothetical protein